MSRKMKVNESQIVYIFLPVHNRREITLNFVNCLLKQHYLNYHLVLIDDGSADDTAGKVKEKCDKLTIIQGDGNLWWAGALQKGYLWLKENSITGDEIVLLMNDDIEFDSNFLSNGVRILNENPNTFLTAYGFDIKTKNPRDTGVYNFDFQEFVFTETRDPQKINCSSTRGLITRASDFLDVGGFRPKLLPHYLSDIEFTARAKAIGKKLISHKDFSLWIDFETTGYKLLNEDSFKVFLKKSFSKRSAMNPVYWSIFVFLRSPIKYIPINLARIWWGFFTECRKNLSANSKIYRICSKIFRKIRAL
jgi:GT2 family glycosyltransferase